MAEVIQCARCNLRPAAAFLEIDKTPSGQPVLSPRCTQCMVETALPMRFMGEVTTPAIPREPNNPMWLTLKRTRSKSGLLKLADQAERQGYAPDGQLRTEIKRRLTSTRRTAR